MYGIPDIPEFGIFLQRSGDVRYMAEGRKSPKKVVENRKGQKNLQETGKKVTGKYHVPG